MSRSRPDAHRERTLTEELEADDDDIEVSRSRGRNGKHSWTPREDEIVKQSIMRFLAANSGTEEVPVDVWKAVTSKLGNCRTVKQCRERWRNQLDPSIVLLPWTPEEDATIDRLRALHGNAWKLIASQLPGRSENAIKNRHYAHERRRERAVKRSSHDVFDGMPSTHGTSGYSGPDALAGSAAAGPAGMLPGYAGDRTGVGASYGYALPATGSPFDGHGVASAFPFSGRQGTDYHSGHGSPTSAASSSSFAGTALAAAHEGSHSGTGATQGAGPSAGLQELLRDLLGTSAGSPPMRGAAEPGAGYGSAALDAAHEFKRRRLMGDGLDGTSGEGRYRGTGSAPAGSFDLSAVFSGSSGGGGGGGGGGAAGPMASSGAVSGLVGSKRPPGSFLPVSTARSYADWQGPSTGSAAMPASFITLARGASGMGAQLQPSSNYGASAGTATTAVGSAGQLQLALEPLFDGELGMGLPAGASPALPLSSQPALGADALATLVGGEDGGAHLHKAGASGFILPLHAPAGTKPLSTNLSLPTAPQARILVGASKASAEPAGPAIGLLAAPKAVVMQRAVSNASAFDAGGATPQLASLAGGTSEVPFGGSGSGTADPSASAQQAFAAYRDAYARVQQCEAQYQSAMAAGDQAAARRIADAHTQAVARAREVLQSPPLRKVVQQMVSPPGTGVSYAAGGSGSRM